jgi:hypothetical protein
MPRLATFGRPYVMFDPKNRDHRKWFAYFVRTSSWGKCPVRFLTDDDHGNSVAIMHRMLVEYYTKREFARPSTK